MKYRVLREGEFKYTAQYKKVFWYDIQAHRWQESLKEAKEIIQQHKDDSVKPTIVYEE